MTGTYSIPTGPFTGYVLPAGGCQYTFVPHRNIMHRPYCEVLYFKTRQRNRNELRGERRAIRRAEWQKRGRRERRYAVLHIKHLHRRGMWGR